MSIVKKLTIPAESQRAVFGANDKYKNLIEKTLDVKIITRGEEVSISDEQNAKIAHDAIGALVKLSERFPINTSDVVTAIESSRRGEINKFLSLYEVEILKDVRGNPITLKSISQKAFVDSAKNHDVIFAVGAPGTGKTMIGVVLGVQALKEGLVETVVIVSTTVENDEKLGFLPGDILEKVDPHMQPIYNCLDKILGVEKRTAWMQKGKIKVSPLAFQRGITFDKSFVILDEAQNTTVSQMRMFLTRLGLDSKMVITGDPSQIDLPKWQKSGLVDAVELLESLRKSGDIDIIFFDDKDVIRHPLVGKISKLYGTRDKNDREKAQVKNDVGAVPENNEVSDA